SVVLQCNANVSIPHGLYDVALSVYPNPTADFLHIRSADPIDNVLIFNIHGEVVAKQYLNESRVVNTYGLPNGHYLIKGFKQHQLIFKTGFIKQ
ncbi:MAG: T9SS type A sorting domain-containing protein, partial [Chitinophagales bacterium]